MNSLGDETRHSAFKRAQLRHKRQGKNPNRSDDLSEVVDFGRTKDDRIVKLELPETCRCHEEVYKGPIYGLEGFPGFLFAPQALSESLQIEIAYQSVREFCELPNRTNIDQCPPKQMEEINHGESMWDLWKKSNMSPAAPKKQKLDYSKMKKYHSFKKLSWATMGYHYDWTERSYSKESKSPIPSAIANLSKIFANTSLLLDAPKSSKKNPNLQFFPEASIVNYYNAKSSMGGHRDELELALDKPVVSMSMGLTAIFLLGGKTKDEEPVIPILIRPGDVMCFGGDARLNYHSMARLLPANVSIPAMDQALYPRIEDQLSKASLAFIFPKHQEEEQETIEISSNDRLALEEYLSHHRININVRQVYPDD